MGYSYPMKAETKQYLGNIVKTALIFAVIGGALAFGAPYIAVAVGKASVVTATPLFEILFQGAFFGLFGAMSSGLTPIVDSIFKKPAPAATAENFIIPHESSLAAGMSNALSHGMAHAPAYGGHAPAGHAAGLMAAESQSQFASRLDQQRALLAAQPGITQIQ